MSRVRQRELQPAPLEPQRTPQPASPLELWGGVECTLNRVGECCFDQLERSGHAQRLDDLNLFAELGLKAMRYPALWERVAPHGLDVADWSWTDERLNHLRSLGIEPIVGLLHHGSGPAYTNLLDPDFPTHLAEYARAVAARYPWVTQYTPINEPLTTARFSGLYGHWQPHGRDGLTFARILLGQCRAIQLAMQAIREVNPAARLVQTEDVGRTHSTQQMAYQADFENERRWLTFDLLCGRVNKAHPMHHYLCWLGMEEDALRRLQETPCPPDMLGIDYYVSSERFLDERVEQYPPHTWGGNAREQYADLEAVRVRAEGIDGPGSVLREVWERYGLPLALTEVHLGCEVDEQIRWFAQVWNEAADQRRAGVDVRAVTAWALLGAYDWDSLVTRADGHYEAGTFDLSGGLPVATPLAALLRSLGQPGWNDHPALQTPGWWRRPERLLYPPPCRINTEEH